MRNDALFRLAGLASLLAGAGRILSTFAWTGDAVSREALYDAIDALLLFAVMGVYFSRKDQLGALGFASFAVAIAALSFIGGPDADPFGFSTYQQGAYALAIAMVGISLAWWRAKQKPLWAPACWFLSVIAAGVMRMLPPPAPDYGFAAAGLLFGLGFVFAGLDLIRTRTPG
ncbi:MAG: hypothetical protein JSS00_09360 [Proteobacteria bacterium]|nr:hypothetical protein [Pseudomonadota bacterium]